MEQLALAWELPRNIYSVSELSAQLRALLEERFASVRVTGEISGAKLAASGHYYFTLKDASAQLRCVCFRMTARYLKFKPQDGIAVVARGRIELYEARGEYQLLVDHLEPLGHGALQAAFEELKRKLQEEGLFDAARKRPIPKLPRRIGLVTSPSGAVIQDMLQILERRFPGLHIRLYPAQVQGEGAADQICKGLACFSQWPWADVVIVARGGGSLEDLWAFNEEPVARAIAASPIPVVSAVGHETDFTIADFVADLRAPTPSAAAELVICTREQIFEQIAACERRLLQTVRYRIGVGMRQLNERGTERAMAVAHRSIGRRLQRVDEMEYRLRDRFAAAVRARQGPLDSLRARLYRLDPRLQFAEAHRRLDASDAALLRWMPSRLAVARARLERLEAQAAQLSPQKVLDRGYALVRDSEGRLVKDALSRGKRIQVRVARGEFGADVV